MGAGGGAGLRMCCSFCGLEAGRVDSAFRILGRKSTFILKCHAWLWGSQQLEPRRREGRRQRGERGIGGRCQEKSEHVDDDGHS